VLGRSQDLAAYRRVEMVELEQAPAAYAEGTLLPFRFRELGLTIGESLAMPQLIDPSDRAKVSWGRYVAVEQRVFLGVSEKRPNTVLGPFEDPFDIDPGTEEHDGFKRAVIWHGFTDEDARIQLAAAR